MAKAEIQQKIDTMAAKLADTKVESRYRRDPVGDALVVVAPMMEDLLGIMSDILKEVKD